MTTDESHYKVLRDKVLGLITKDSDPEWSESMLKVYFSMPLEVLSSEDALDKLWDAYALLRFFATKWRSGDAHLLADDINALADDSAFIGLIGDSDDLS